MNIVKFSINETETSKMWNFSLKHDVIFQWEGLVGYIDDNHVYAYHGIMDEDTSVLFKLIVPTVVILKE